MGQFNLEYAHEDFTNGEFVEIFVVNEQNSIHNCGSEDFYAK